MLKYRFITALIALPLLLSAIIYLPLLYFACLVAAVVALSAWEWSGIIGFTNLYLRSIYVVVVLLGLYFVRPIPVFSMFVIGFLIWLWAAAAVYRFNQGKKPCGFQFPEVQAIAGFFILVTLWLALVNLRLGAGSFDAIRLIMGLLIIFAADTGAYFSGRWWGKHALASRVSPKKTWEGLLGGLVFAVIVAMVPTFLFPMTMMQRIAFLGLAMLVVIFSVIGDLTVSLLKRQAGVKDSGHLLPGHGGILDRVDSVAAGILVFALGLTFF